MTNKTLPFGSSAIQTETDWEDIFGRLLRSGIFHGESGEFEVTVDSGLTLDIGSGTAWAQGTLGMRDAESKTLGARNATNPRWDRIVLRRDLATDTFEPQVLQGAPAVSPSFPAITRAGNVYDLYVARIYVDDSGSTPGELTSGDIFDEREWVGPKGFDLWTAYPLVFVNTSGPVLTLANHAENRCEYKVVGDTCFVSAKYLATHGGSAGSTYGVQLPIPPVWNEQHSAARVENTAGQASTLIASKCAVLRKNDGSALNISGAQFFDGFDLAYRIA